VLVGDGPEEAALRDQVESLGLTRPIDWLGFQPQEAVRAWMQRARVFVLPSLEEGQGVVLLEAMASGTPVIASDVDGIREVVTPDVGFRTPPADPPTLAAALTTLLADDALWLKMSRAARCRAVEQYDWPLIARRFIDLYATLVG
jgi:glycosyltransferase involved in cell wall biosynthesis